MPRRPRAELVFLYTTLPDQAAADGLARHLIEKKLAACVNIVPGVVSHYVWDGALERSGEVIVLIKTRRQLLAAARAEVVARHPYETPALLVLPIEDVNDAYLRWALGETREA